MQSFPSNHKVFINVKKKIESKPAAKFLKWTCELGKKKDRHSTIKCKITFRYDPITVKTITKRVWCRFNIEPFCP